MSGYCYNGPSSNLLSRLAGIRVEWGFPTDQHNLVKSDSV
ncbi:hypothetical protein PL11201_680151 [Planktothrix sp. PCC 11201]|nr:hypothetical protein PL11201_680151 [Planktothrix sp. PCC 11201]